MSCDLLVAGGGVVGLWLAYLAAQKGLRVVLVERDRLGSGASGGFLGALMPHMPERWNPKKQFQFEALQSLAGHVDALENETGMSTGYRRCGRLMPLAAPHQKALALERVGQAQSAWRTRETGFSFSVREDAWLPGWPDRGSMPSGSIYETLSARIDPRALVAALARALSLRANVTLIERDGVASIDARAGSLRLASGSRMNAGTIAVAAGHESFAMMAPLLQRPAAALGKAVKGQAALLRKTLPADAPLVFRDGLYIVPHEGGFVAVGSTSEDAFEHAFTTDGQLENLIHRATALCPMLAEAAVVERWAGLRPKAIGRDPMIGFLPDTPRILTVTGGFKITFGIARRMAEKALALAIGEGDASLPESFRVSSHLEKAEKTTTL